MNESDLQLAVSKYIALQYPKVLFNVDMSGVRLPIGMATKMKKMRSGRAWPDIFIAEPRGQYCGMFLELKRSEKDLLKKNGEIRKTKHLIEQGKMLDELTDRGYFATFAVGFDESKKLIDEYLNNNSSGR